ncbi:hypothetical protein ASPWEDRAFT_99066 [Aspergillus wentii DTO 134E9]|uniref:Uncharacterized protein n=1 Tax=Aspergillus wentii DTO 134E9 TaxID=1073089 RepID=A0A1L9S3U6_ASPWE|nr:uncharacterized protein ASPWEDRAFT_99066 [Aspergillus wentii DTO 134E9]OJJ41820.1 hypothetical protein ASPWEDRAFT_99066 [Aspergillus wentii DTO 134E9]
MNYYTSTSTAPKQQRHLPCQVFSDNNIPYVVWFEDALHYHGVPTVVFDLFILVPDIDIDVAADCLVKSGWIVDTERPHRIGNAIVDLPQRPVISPDRHTRTVLLPAADWKFHLSTDTVLEKVPLEDSAKTVPYPPLAALLDSLIESWLDCPAEDSGLLIHLACQYGYLYQYVPAVKERSFAEKMRYEHRQFHNDVLSEMKAGTLPFRKHERAIRDALVRGEYEITECSAPKDNADLFDVGKEERLLARKKAIQEKLRMIDPAELLDEERAFLES